MNIKVGGVYTIIWGLLFDAGIYNDITNFVFPLGIWISILGQKNTSISYKLIVFYKVKKATIFISAFIWIWQGSIEKYISTNKNKLYLYIILISKILLGTETLPI